MGKHAHTRFFRGITLLEVIVSIGILMMLTSLAIAPFANYRDRKALESSAETVLAVFSQAHLDAISSKGNISYGVRIRSNDVVLFSGSVYPGDGSPGNVVYPLATSVIVSAASFSNSCAIGSCAIVFSRLSGQANPFGTFTLQAKNRSTMNIVITVSGIGALSF